MEYIYIIYTSLSIIYNIIRISESPIIIHLPDGGFYLVYYFSTSSIVIQSYSDSIHGNRITVSAYSSTNPSQLGGLGRRSRWGCWGCWGLRRFGLDLAQTSPFRSSQGFTNQLGCAGTRIKWIICGLYMDYNWPTNVVGGLKQSIHHAWSSSDWKREVSRPGQTIDREMLQPWISGWQKTETIYVCIWLLPWVCTVYYCITMYYMNPGWHLGGDLVQGLCSYNPAGHRVRSYKMVLGSK